MLDSTDEPPSVAEAELQAATRAAPCPNGAPNGASNGHSNGHLADASLSKRVSAPPPKSLLRTGEADGLQDLICVGFGPASLAIAVALQDALAAGTARDLPGLLHGSPRVLFVERQPRFAWHAGMLLPGAKMQISFVKDLATLRDPCSEFTFLNYLHRNGRLVPFSNLGTFLPLRLEYEDYLRWCASAFDDVARYGCEAVEVTPGETGASGKVESFAVTLRDAATGRTHLCRARHVVIAVGGRPYIPKTLPQQHPRVIHSSRYSTALPQVLLDPDAPHRFAVIGGGQSAAEIFNDLKTRYPRSTTRLIIKGAALRPSDDSPLCV